MKMNYTHHACINHQDYGHKILIQLSRNYVKLDVPDIRF